MKHTDPAADGGSGRVSPTAPSSKSASTAVWRLLEQNAEFTEGMERARKEYERGEFAPFVRKAPRTR